MVTPVPDTIDGKPLDNRRRWLWVTLLFVLALGMRSYDLGGSGIQNDEQLWHERSARFIQSVLGPVAPNEMEIPTVYWPRMHVDLTDDSFIISSGYPFNIKMPAPHPGTPMGFLIGLSYLFLAEGSGGWSLELVSDIEATRIPGVLVGSLLVLAVFFVGRRLFGERAAVFASLLMAVEPTMVGYSRLARIDLSGALWTTLAVLFFIQAQRRHQVAGSIAAGVFAGLATATNPYGLYILPALIAVKFLYGRNSLKDFWTTYDWRVWQWLDKMDWVLMVSCAGAFFLTYPNLWPNLFLGIYEIFQIITSLPHIKGEPTSLMPISHWFYLLRVPEHLLPWTLLCMFMGITVGMRRARRATILLLIWGGVIVLLLSLAPGRKGFKNFLLVMPVVMMFAGIGIDGLLSWITRHRPDWEMRSVLGLTALLIFLGFATTVSWWPYPQIYTWPWRPDPQTQPLREIVAGGEGVKEAMSYIRENGSSGDKVAMITGKHNAAFYYNPDLLQDVGAAKYPEGFDWLVSLPKITFTSAGDLPLIRWIRTTEPDYIVRQHQIELVRVYRPKKNGFSTGPWTREVPSRQPEDEK